MVLMAGTAVQPGDRMSVEDWLALEPPDEWYRVELVDGVIVMTSAARDVHGVAVARLAAALLAVRPADAEVVVAPGVVLPDSGLIPDLAVKRHRDLGDLTASPTLVIEVLSRSTRGIDLGAKRRLYAQHGIGSYWLVDLDVPSVTILELGVTGAYVHVASAHPGAPVSMQDPFPMTVDVDALLA